MRNVDRQTEHSLEAEKKALRLAQRQPDHRAQGNFTTVFAKAILAATLDAVLVDPRKKKPGGDRGVSSEQIARMEREIARPQTPVK